MSRAVEPRKFGGERSGDSQEPKFVGVPLTPMSPARNAHQAGTRTRERTPGHLRVPVSLSPGSTAPVVGCAAQQLRSGRARFA